MNSQCGAEVYEVLQAYLGQCHLNSYVSENKTLRALISCG